MRRIELFGILCLFFLLSIPATKAGTFLDSSYAGPFPENNTVLNYTGNAGKFNWDESKAYAMSVCCCYYDCGVGMYRMNKTTSHLSLMWYNNSYGSISDGDKYFDVLVSATGGGVIFINGTTGRIFNSYTTGSYTNLAKFVNNWQNVIVIQATTMRSPFTKNVWLFDKYGNLLDTDSFYIDGNANYIVHYNNPSSDTFSICLHYGYRKCVSYRISGGTLDKTYEGDLTGQYVTSLYNDGHYVFVSTQGGIYIYNQTLNNPVFNFTTNTSSYPFNVVGSDFGGYYRIATTTTGSYPDDYAITYNWYPSNNSVVKIDQAILNQYCGAGAQEIFFVTPRTFYLECLNLGEIYIALNGTIMGAPQSMSIQVSPSGNTIHIKDFISSDEETDYLFNNNLNRVGNQAYTYCFCNCTNYTGGSCYNTTHSIYTRSCHPSQCYEESYLLLNSSCIPPTPGSPTCSACNWTEYNGTMIRGMCSIGNLIICYPVIFITAVIVILVIVGLVVWELKKRGQ